MKNQHVKIALKGQEYATPRTESVAVINQGAVLTGSVGGGGRGSFGFNVGKGGLS